MRISDWSSDVCSSDLLTLGIAVNFTDLLFLHTRSKIADAQFESARLSVGGATLDLAAEVEAAYRRVSAATRQSQLQATLTRAAQASATLAQRYYADGHHPLRDVAQIRKANESSHKCDARNP